MVTIFEQVFEKLVKLGILSEDGKVLYQYMRFENGSDAFMPLSMDRLDVNRISLAHNTIQNGDVMCDPDMEMLIYPEAHSVIAYSFQNDFAGYYDNALVDDGINMRKASEHTDFLNDWLSNVEAQGYKLIRKEEIDD